MPTYGMGDAMREMRIRLGYTQEEMAYGICTPGTLSRIENGKAAVSKQVFEALCTRMPGLHHIWISLDTETEMRRSGLCKQILLYLESGKTEDAKMALESYRRIADFDSPFCRQFLQYAQAICQAVLKENEKEILPMLQTALEITMPDYRERLKTLKKAVALSYDEVYILSNMGIAYARRGEPETAFEMFRYLKEYMEKQSLDKAESMRISPMILGNLAWILKCQGRFDEAVRQCNRGIEVCCLIGNYTVLPNLLCIKAYCLTAVGRVKIAEKCRRQAKAILDITEEYRGYGSFQEFYKATEPIFVTF